MKLAAVLITAIAFLFARPVYAVDSCSPNFGVNSQERSLFDIVGNEKVMNRLISTNDGFWTSLSEQLATAQPGKFKNLDMDDENRHLEASFAHNKKTGEAKITIFKFRTKNLQYGATPKSMSLQFSRMIASIAFGLKELKNSGVEVNHVSIKADQVVNSSLIESLLSVGFHYSKTKIFLNKWFGWMALEIYKQPDDLYLDIDLNESPSTLSPDALQ
jgi:hypothetical protein